MSQHANPAVPVGDAPIDASVDESALIAGLRAGDESAYLRFVSELSPRLLAVARRMMGNDDDASDALQDAFLSAFKNLASFDGRSRLSTWMHRVVVNACLMKLRKARRRNERAIESLLPSFTQDGHAAAAPGEWSDTPGGGAHRADLMRIVREKIEELPEQYRTVLVLRDIEQLDTEAAAEVLGESVSAVKTRLHRARQALRELLDPMMRKGDL
ncbi:MAG: RNA polymerase sigma factor [Phycisphaerales bacterium]